MIEVIDQVFHTNSIGYLCGIKKKKSMFACIKYPGTEYIEIDGQMSSWKDC